MTKRSLFFSILTLLIAGSEVSFASYQTTVLNTTLSGEMPTGLRRQSNDLFSNTYRAASPATAPQNTPQLQVASLAVNAPVVPTKNPGRAVPAGAPQDPQGNRAINCKNPQGDFACMACNCYNEAAHRYDDQLAVSKVVMTRVNLREYPNTVCAVVKQPKQFSWYNKLRTRKTVPANDSCMKAATEALQFRGYFADHYHANYVRPRWRRNMTAVAQVGVHIYYSRFDASDLNRRGGTTVVAGL